MQNRHKAQSQVQNVFSSKDNIRQFNTNQTGVTNRFGGAERDRTADPLLAKQVLSQLSYSPNLSMDCLFPTKIGHTNRNGGPGQTRTADLTLIRRAL